MSTHEAHKSPPNRNISLLVTAAVAVTAASVLLATHEGGDKNAASPRSKSLPTPELTAETPKPTVDPLSPKRMKIGDSINSLRYLTYTVGQDQSTTLIANPGPQSLDDAIMYSRVFQGETVKPATPNPEVSTFYMISSRNHKFYLRLFTFDQQTDEIVGLSDPDTHPIKSGLVEVAYHPDFASSFTLNHDGSLSVRFDAQPPIVGLPHLLSPTPTTQHA